MTEAWGIDSAIVVSAENGITPEAGSQMARANSGVGTDLYTLIDVTSMAGEIIVRFARFPNRAYASSIWYAS